MSQDPDQIRQDIEATREAMDATLDQIEDRITPSRIAERKADEVRARWADAKASVMGTAEDARDRVVGTVEDVKDSVLGTAGDAKDAAAGAVDEARGGAGGLRDRVDEAAGRSASAAQRQVKGNPLAAGMIALGLGALAGSLLPRTRAEHRATQQIEPALDPVKEGLAAAGEELAQDLKEEAQDAASEVADTASEAVEAVKQDVTHAADEVRADGQEAVAAVREEAGAAADETSGAELDEEDDAAQSPVQGDAHDKETAPDAAPSLRGEERVGAATAEPTVQDITAVEVLETGAEVEPARGAGPLPRPDAGGSGSGSGTLTAAGMEPEVPTPAPTSPGTRAGTEGSSEDGGPELAAGAGAKAGHDDPPASGAAGGAYEDMTVDELLEVAGERDITGRWSMTKDELIDALRETDGGADAGDDFEDQTVEELLELAGERDITGRWSMTKDQLVAALREAGGSPAGSSSRSAQVGSSEEAPAQDRPPSRRTTRYEDRTVDELRQLAAERDITGRSSMTKDELIAALRR